MSSPMRYVIVFPNTISLHGITAGEYTMHYVDHRENPFGLTSDDKLKNARIFDKFEEAREIEYIINANSGNELVTTIMKIK